MKVALAHDYLTQRGGAERVALEMTRAFPGAPLYTSLFHLDQTYPEFAEVDVRPSPLQHVSHFRSHHRRALPLLAPTFSSMRIDADVVIVSSSGWAHGVRTDAPKIVYCHNPARWLYQRDEYLTNKTARSAARPLLAALRSWDQRAASGASSYLANSAVVAGRIERAYGIEAAVLHPPGGLVEGPQQRPIGIADEFVLTVCRLLDYKNVDAVVEGVAGVDGPQLVVVGSGPDGPAIRRRAAGTDTVFLEGISDAELRWLYQHCTALVSASHEDFGLTPVEAAGFGRPSVVLAKAGFLETVIAGETGVFFDEPIAVEIAAAVQTCLSTQWDAAYIMAHAKAFGPEAFRVALVEHAREAMNT